jgi:hypothetical protein
MEPTQKTSDFFFERLSRARLVFLIAFLLVTAFFSLGYWNVLPRHGEPGFFWVAIPGFSMLEASAPWSMAWFGLPLHAKIAVPHELRPLLDIFAPALGFSINCFLGFYLLSAIVQMIRINKSLQRTQASNRPHR